MVADEPPALGCLPSLSVSYPRQCWPGCFGSYSHPCSTILYSFSFLPTFTKRRWPCRRNQHLEWLSPTALPVSQPSVSSSPVTCDTPVSGIAPASGAYPFGAKPLPIEGPTSPHTPDPASFGHPVSRPGNDADWKAAILAAGSPHHQAVPVFQPSHTSAKPSIFRGGGGEWRLVQLWGWAWWPLAERAEANSQGTGLDNGC